MSLGLVVGLFFGYMINDIITLQAEDNKLQKQAEYEETQMVVSEVENLLSEADSEYLESLDLESIDLLESN